MPQAITLENNFVQGLRTEYTGLNFPENAATETFNCYFDRKGNVRRRFGFDYEANYTLTLIDRDAAAISTFKWDNAGGSGGRKFLVVQVGASLRFFRIDITTTANPLSSLEISSGPITLSDYVPSGGSFNAAVECTYAAGNGYVFVFHPSIEPFAATYVSGDNISVTPISIKTRDFTGAIDSLEDSVRPETLSWAHAYNIYNQGWYAGTAWTASSTTSVSPTGTGNKTWTIETGKTISVSQVVVVQGYNGSGVLSCTMTGTVVSYNSGSGQLVINITATDGSAFGGNLANWTFSAAASGIVDTFETAAGAYPSNADVWWRFKDSTGVYSPGTTLANVSQFAGPAPKGRFIINEFYQDRSSVSGLNSISLVSTLARPSIGAWFQGRVWYAGVNARFEATGTAVPYSWTENIYFSQIIEKPTQFERCYQVNDPTSEDLFDLLPSDGGVIRLQGAGQIFKLFPVQNGLLVFAANGIWFITGSQGIGFTANDYTVTKISGVRTVSSTSFVDVQGWPFFWNEDGIYAVSPGAQGNGISVENIVKKTILSFYQDIPNRSKQYARGDYDPLNMIIQWCYRSTNETNSTDRYEFDRILCLNLATGAFYPYSISGTPKIHAVNYPQFSGGSTAPEPMFKYLTSATDGSGSYNFTFSDETQTFYEDWDAYGTVLFESYFVTGYKIHGKAVAKVSPNYVYVFVNNETNAQYKIQGIWDYAIHADSNRFSSEETATVTASTANFGKAFKRHRVRGHGYVLQFKITSVAGQPFDIQGWSVHEVINTSV